MHGIIGILFWCKCYPMDSIDEVNEVIFFFVVFLKDTVHRSCINFFIVKDFFLFNNGCYLCYSPNIDEGSEMTESRPTYAFKILKLLNSLFATYALFILHWLALIFLS